MKTTAAVITIFAALAAPALGLEIPPAKGKCQSIQARCALFAHGETAAPNPNIWRPQQFGCNPATGRWVVDQRAGGMAWQACLNAGLASGGKP
jgi:hypothetical protein